MINYYTAGESHGSQLTGIITGVPSNLKINIDEINSALKARQGGFGRGNRQKIENDTVQITSGMRHGITLGSPISLNIKNRDNSHWNDIMNTTSEATNSNTLRKVTSPRPGHADLVGGMKYAEYDLRNVLERSSARETAMRVAIGQICKQLLRAVDIKIIGYVEQVGKIKVRRANNLSISTINSLVHMNDLRIIDQSKVEEIHRLITRVRKSGDTLGGVVSVLVDNVPTGLGSYTSWDTKLDAHLASAVMGVNAIKGVEIGDGFEASENFGSQVMDEICWNETEGWSRKTNHLGGFEGGMTNGMPIIIRAAMKPIPTLYKPLHSVDIHAKNITKATVQRSDTTAIVPASIIVESVISIEIAKILTDTFDGSELVRLKNMISQYRSELKKY